MTRYAQQMGARFLGMLKMGGQLVFLFQDIIRCLFRYPIRFGLLVRQIDFIGAKSVPVVIITGGFIGAVFAAAAKYDSCLRINYARQLTDEIKNAIQRIGEVVKQRLDER